MKYMPAGNDEIEIWFVCAAYATSLPAVFSIRIFTRPVFFIVILPVVGLGITLMGAGLFTAGTDDGPPSFTIQ